MPARARKTGPRERAGAAAVVPFGGRVKQEAAHLTEGVVPYLSEADVGLLADDLKALEHSRFWDWFGFFEAHRWRRKDSRYLAEEGERLKRPIQLSVVLKLVLGLRALFRTKERRGAAKWFVGYALLERDITA
jgi:hypothetical protein